MAKKTVNSDIYNLSRLVEDVKSVFLPDENEETLAIGTYGYLGALEAKRLQTQVQMTGELCNEVFPSRARLERNVITHAIMMNIENINAVPAKMTAFLALKESDITDYFDENNIFTIDRDCPLMIGDYEFHLEYDIKLKRIYIEKKATNTYTAQYDIPANRDVPTSTITSANQYLSPPTVVNVNHENYIYLTAILAQVEHNVVSKKLVTSNIIDNKTMNFEFTNQLAYFEIHSKESDQDYYITPVFEGSAVPDDVNAQYYCWYQYIDTNLIRVRFDRQSYMPGLNATVECLVKTCQGASGNFTYGKDVYATLESSNYNYKNITCLITPISNSSGGIDRKSKKELQGIIPKEALSRGSLTTITDLNNYFGMLDSDYGRIVIQKKIDNQIERVYYAYFVAKDTNGDIIPSNTIDIRVPMDALIESRINEVDSPRYLLPAGTCFKLGTDGVGYINEMPILGNGYEFTGPSVSRGDIVESNFTIEITEEEKKQFSTTVEIGGCNSATHVFPDTTTGSLDGKFTYEKDESTPPQQVEDYIQMGVGKKYVYTTEYITQNDNSIIQARDKYLSNLDFVDAYYTVDGVTRHFSSLPIVITDLPKDTKITFGIVRRLNDKSNGITYFKYGSNQYNLVQNLKVNLSTVLSALDFSGEISDCKSSNTDYVTVTPNGTVDKPLIMDPNDPEAGVPSENETNKPYKLSVVTDETIPPVSIREKNEWFYREMEVEQTDQDASTKPAGTLDNYDLKVTSEKDMPALKDRKENEWYMGIVSSTRVPNGAEQQESNDKNDYSLNVVKEDELPAIEDRPQNNWYYIVDGVEYAEGDPDDPEKPTNRMRGNEYIITITKQFGDDKPISLNVIIDSKLYTINLTQDVYAIENGMYVTEGAVQTKKDIHITYVPKIEVVNKINSVTNNTQITYKISYRSTSYNYNPKIIIKLSRGLDYLPFSNYLKYGDKNYQHEPTETSMEGKRGFVYTNPYAININGYRLYSAFYMMSMEENPYLHFDYINDKSNIQFISTNINWNRPFCEDKNDKYTLRIELMQSVQDDLGVIPEGEDDEVVPLIKAFVVFRRNNTDYRYRALNLESFDKSNYSFTFTQQFNAEDIFDQDNNIKLTNVQVCGQNEYIVTITGENNKDTKYTLNNGAIVTLSAILNTLGIKVPTEFDTMVVSNNSALTLIPIKDEEEKIIDYKIISLTDFSDEIQIAYTDKTTDTPTILTATSTQPATTEYGFFNPTTEMKIYTLVAIPDTSGTYSRNGFDSICPGLRNWTLTNTYDVVNGVTMYHNYSEIMGSRVKPYGTDVEKAESDTSATTMDLKGYYVASVPMIGYDYTQDEALVQSAINALNYRKAYIESALIRLENSFGIDFKLFNTYGPSKTFYIIKDKDNNGLLDDNIEFINKVNLSLYFRVKLVADNDSYTKGNIVQEIKDYIEDLNDLSELHIPNLVTQITTNYKEQITYFEYLGFNDYGADVQHIYKLDDSKIPIHVAPEFLNVNNVLEKDGTTAPDINIYVSEI